MNELSAAKLSAATFLTTFADRLVQIQLLALVVVSGPSGEGNGLGALALLLPTVLIGLAGASMVGRLKHRRVLMLTVLLRGLLALSVPALLVYTGGGRLLVLALVTILGALSALFSFLRLGVIPRLVQPGASCLHASALIWFCLLAATAAAVAAAPWLTQDSMEDALKLATVLYFVAVLPLFLLPRSIDSSDELPTLGQAVPILWRKKPLLRFWLSNTAYTLLFSAWFLLLTTLVVAGCQPGGTDLHPAFTFLLCGLGIGALFSFLRRRKLSGNSLKTCVALILLQSILSAGATWLYNTSVPIYGTFYGSLRLSAFDFLLWLSGVACGMGLVSADAAILKLTPARLVAPLAGMKEAVVTLLLLLAAVTVEQLADQVSLLTIYRSTAIGHLILIALIVLTALLQVRRRQEKAKAKARTAL